MHRLSLAALCSMLCVLLLLVFSVDGNVRGHSERGVWDAAAAASLQEDDSLAEMEVGSDMYLEEAAEAAPPTPKYESEPNSGVCSRSKKKFPRYARIFDYIVVGSGGGGGTVAANLAEAGYSVLLLEAGGDSGLKRSTLVPAFYGAAQGDPEITLDYYAAGTEERKILVPRASTLGGGTQTNSLTALRAPDTYWNNVGKITGDASYNNYTFGQHLFRNVERCLYRVKSRSQETSHHHGYKGWLPTSQLKLPLFMKNPSADPILTSMMTGPIPVPPQNKFFDPNDDAGTTDWTNGTMLEVMTINEKKLRFGSFTRLKEVKKKHKKKLTIEVHTLVERILFNNDTKPVAMGVLYQKGKNLLSADRKYVGKEFEAITGEVFARREVIISAGAFHTPQLLMLSGVGDEKYLQSMNITLTAHSPGVGKNLQDHYEVNLVNQLVRDLSTFAACSFNTEGEGPATECQELYANNGVFATLSYPSKHAEKANRTYFYQFHDYSHIKDPEMLEELPHQFPLSSKFNHIRAKPDLFIYGQMGSFKGFHNKDWYDHAHRFAKNKITFTVRKTPMSPQGVGEITLASRNVREVPQISLGFWKQQNAKEDLEAMVQGVMMARKFWKHDFVVNTTSGEIHPGEIVGNTEEEITAFIKNFVRPSGEPCCSAAMGAKEDAMTVVDSKFQVKGVERLRIVDSSAFPSLPGQSIHLPLYLFAQKASIDIIADAKASGSCSEDGGGKSICEFTWKERAKSTTGGSSGGAGNCTSTSTTTSSSSSSSSSTTSASSSSGAASGASSGSKCSNTTSKPISFTPYASTGSDGEDFEIIENGTEQDRYTYWCFCAKAKSDRLCYMNAWNETEQSSGSGSSSSGSAASQLRFRQRRNVHIARALQPAEY